MSVEMPLSAPTSLLTYDVDNSYVKKRSSGRVACGLSRFIITTIAGEGSAEVQAID
jgi:hypothetical protein